MRAQRAKIWLERADLKLKDQWGGGMDKQIDRETNRWTDGCLEIHPCVLQDSRPLVLLPIKVALSWKADLKA